MIDSVMLWNEPNNLSHWDFELDVGWTCFAELVKQASAAIRAERPSLPRVLGGIAPIDAGFLATLRDLGALAPIDVVAVHGFPLDWNHWKIHEWPGRVAEIERSVEQPVWVTEAGVSTFGAEEVQEFGLRRTAELLIGRVPRVHWYSLYDLPRAWPATTRHREAEGSSYYRHFSMGLLREDGTPKRALGLFHDYTPALGICQWFHFEDPRLERTVRREQRREPRPRRSAVAAHEQPLIAHGDLRRSVLGPLAIHREREARRMRVFGFVHAPVEAQEARVWIEPR